MSFELFYVLTSTGKMIYLSTRIYTFSFIRNTLKSNSNKIILKLKK